ncbi:Uncharacterized protein Fot_11621 [Forsythia ovata]|uniref:Uncharacterized protein n=1 Tax=Forsythia ovata TaxID=205694 RepID=A0ABD1WK79_9LAMI
MRRRKCKEFSLVVTMKQFFDYLVDPSDIQNNGPHMVPASMEAIMLMSRKMMEYETDDTKVESCTICLEEIVERSMQPWIGSEGPPIINPNPNSDVATASAGLSLPLEWKFHQVFGNARLAKKYTKSFGCWNRSDMVVTSP